MAKKHLAITLIAFCIFLNTGKICAQNKEFRDTQVDSATFFKNRKLLNDLNSIQFEKAFFKSNSTVIPYRLLSPKENKKNEKYPLIITFHNSTRIGDDNESQLEPLARIWLKQDIYEKYQCYVLAPQFNKRSSNYEKNEHGVLVSTPSNDVFLLPKLIKDIQHRYKNIDQNRIYLIGYSMGASTAQNLMNIDPGKFAALVAIAAVPDFSNKQKIMKKNIWLIHGETDVENPYQGSVDFYNELSKNKNLRFTTFSKLNHNNIIIPFLATDEIPEWLFQKRK